MLPFIIAGGIALLTGGIGIKKGMDAKENYSRARAIAEEAEARFHEKKEELEEKREATHKKLEKLGEQKEEILTTSAKSVLSIIQNARTKAELHKYQVNRTELEQLAAIEEDLDAIKAADIGADSAKSLALASLGATGIYGAVATFATASTGTAIGTLSGAAATNATLAWLGGGSLAAGGFGIVGGMWALGGIITGPALAIAGFAMASRSESKLTEATQYAQEADEKIEKMELAIEMLHTLDSGIQETCIALQKLSEAFLGAEAAAQQSKQAMLAAEMAAARKKQGLWNRIKYLFSRGYRQSVELELKSSLDKFDQKIEQLLRVFTAIKQVVQTPLIDPEGKPIAGITYDSKLALAFSNSTE